MKKYAKNAGADNKTPSVPQYFSWINSTNEGSDEKQTIINLDFFKWMKDTYKMEIKIYAWDAGNFDGASDGFGDVNSEKFLSQYPDEYKNVVAKAAESGIRMGLWGSPDGFGDTPEEEKERFDFYVHLCRDYNFALFKLDGVCGKLRESKADVFASMLKECRKYSPDLIVLNHRLDLYDAEKYVTTFLWNGNETYVDVLSYNKITAMHNRAFMFSRGHVRNLSRLAEDHGVCISSSIDYFEDELIYQAFNRSLILAPEMYGNPWFMRDDEFPKLARVYNLHKHNSLILVNGKLLPESYGENACSRGSVTKRFISTGNASWNKKVITLHLDSSTGLEKCDKIAVNLRHPYECHMGIYEYGDTLDVTLMPFRATLIEVSELNEADSVITNCEYETIKENENGEPVEVKILKTDGGKIYKITNGAKSEFITSEKIDIKENAPIYLGSLDNQENNPKNGEQLYEASVFSASSDSLEYRSVQRSGSSKIPQVISAREAFFNQKTYILRGCEARNMFDGKDDTFFDSQSKTYCGNDLRINGGCLRIDLGREYDADSIEIEFFSSDTQTREVRQQTVPTIAETSCDFNCWNSTHFSSLDIIKNDFTVKVVKFTVHTLYDLKGKMLKAVYPVKNKFRYLRIAEPMDRIYHVRLIKDGKKITIDEPHANNMLSHYRNKKAVLVKYNSFTLPKERKGKYLAVALEGVHGKESAYCCAGIDGKLMGFPKRAPDYPANPWEHIVESTDRNNTYFLPLTDEFGNKAIKIYTVFCDSKKTDVKCDVYLCDKH